MTAFFASFFETVVKAAILGACALAGLFFGKKYRENKNEKNQ